jgi:hypothetical protein
MEDRGMMASLLLLDVDRLTLKDARVLGIIMASYGARVLAIAHNGSMQLRIESALIESFLFTVARDVVPVDVTSPFALIG